MHKWRKQSWMIWQAAIEGTPIALNDVAMGAKKMVAAGMEGTKVKGVFQAIADAAYGVGKWC